MKINYKITFKDYKAAVQLHCTNKSGRRLGYYFWYWVIPALALMFVLFDIFDGRWKTTNFNSPFRWFEGGLIWLAIFLPLMRFINLRRYFRILFSKAVRDGDVSLEVTDDSIVSEIPGVSSGKFFWNAIVDFSQNKGATLFYVSNKRFLFLPTAVLSADQNDELHALISRNMVKK
jgi:hypothetical protein